MKSRKESSLKQELVNKLHINLERNLVTVLCSNSINVEIFQTIRRHNNYKIMRTHNMRLAAIIHNSTLRPYEFKD